MLCDFNQIKRQEIGKKKSDCHTQGDAHKMKSKNDYVRKKLHTPVPSFHLFFNVAVFTLANKVCTATNPFTVQIQQAFWS